MKNIAKHELFFKIALVLGSIVEAIIIISIIFLGLQWLGNLLDIICNYVNVGWGIFTICVFLMGFIFLDCKNSSDKCDEPKRTKTKATYHRQSTHRTMT